MNTTNKQIRQFQVRHGLRREYSLTPLFAVITIAVAVVGLQVYNSAKAELVAAQKEYATVQERTLQ